MPFNPHFKVHLSKSILPKLLVQATSATTIGTTFGAPEVNTVSDAWNDVSVNDGGMRISSGKGFIARSRHVLETHSVPDNGIVHLDTVMMNAELSGNFSGFLTAVYGATGIGVSVDIARPLLPNPAHPSLMPCPNPTGISEFNQYTMNGGITSVPAHIQWAGSFEQEPWMVEKASWEWRRAPGVPQSEIDLIPLRAALNGWPTERHGRPPTSEVWAQYSLTPFPAIPEVAGSGIAFSGLPINNSAFGEYQITHKVDGKVIGKSDVAMFYDGYAYDHPGDAHGDGPDDMHGVKLGPKDGSGMYAVIDDHIPVPNWFYYYSQAEKDHLPYLRKIMYCVDSDGTNGSNTGNAHTLPFQSEAPDGEKISFIGDVAFKRDGHQNATFRFPNIEGSTDYRNSFLAWTGYETARGIDDFARVVAHEMHHREMIENYRDSIYDAELVRGFANDIPDVKEDPVTHEIVAFDPNADPDDDGLPTWYEKEHDLDPMDFDTTRIYHLNRGIISGGDSEVDAIMVEQGVFGHMERDWAASPGLNYGTKRPCPNNSTVRVSSVTFPSPVENYWDGNNNDWSTPFGPGS